MYDEPPTFMMKGPSHSTKAPHLDREDLLPSMPANLDRYAVPKNWANLMVLLTPYLDTISLHDPYTEVHMDALYHMSDSSQSCPSRRDRSLDCE